MRFILSIMLIPHGAIMFLILLIIFFTKENKLLCSLARDKNINGKRTYNHATVLKVAAVVHKSYCLFHTSWVLCLVMMYLWLQNSNLP